MSKKEIKQYMELIEATTLLAKFSGRLFESVVETEFDRLGYSLQLLENARVEWLRKNKQKDLESLTNDEFQTPDEVLEYIVTKDPTKNKQYSQWLVKIVANGSTTLKELENATRLLDTFEELRKTELRGFDIGGTKSLNELEKVFIDLEEEQENEEEELEQQAREESEILRDDAKWLIVKPLTQFASCYFARTSNLCTAAGYGRQAGRTNNMFDSYTRGNDYLIIFVNKLSEDTIDSYQFAYIEDNEGELTNFENEHFSEDDYIWDELKDLLPVDYQEDFTPSNMTIYGEFMQAIEHDHFDLRNAKHDIVNESLFDFREDSDGDIEVSFNLENYYDMNEDEVYNIYNGHYDDDILDLVNIKYYDEFIDMNELAEKYNELNNTNYTDEELHELLKNGELEELRTKLNHMVANKLIEKVKEIMKDRLEEHIYVIDNVGNIGDWYSKSLTRKIEETTTFYITDHYEISMFLKNVSYHWEEIFLSKFFLEYGIEEILPTDLGGRGELDYFIENSDCYIEDVSEVFED